MVPPSADSIKTKGIASQLLQLLLAIAVIATILYVGISLFIKGSIDAFQAEQGDRLIYLARPTSVPCEKDKSTECVEFDKANTVFKMRLPKILVSGAPETTNRLIFMPIFVSNDIIRPLKGQMSDPERDKSLVDWHGVSLSLMPSRAPSYFDKALADSMSNYLARPGLPKREKYVQTKSFIPGYVMYDVPTCIGYDESQIDKSNPDNASHPLYKACELMTQFFLPSERSDAYISCPRRILFNGTYTDPGCTAISFFEPELVQVYLFKQSLLIDQKWKEVDRKLQEYFRSLIVSN